MEKYMEEKRKGDLYYRGINRLPEAGLPIGNGRMGTLVWLTENALHMQINRVDVFGMDSSSRSVSVTDSDYSGGCAFLDIEFSDFSDPVFGEDTVQRLVLEKGRIEIEGKGLLIRCYADMDDDFLVVETERTEAEERKVTARLRALRYQSQYAVGRRNYSHPTLRRDGVVSCFRQQHQLATTVLRREDGRIGLKQEFEEGGFCCVSFVEVEAVGCRTFTGCSHASEVVLTAVPEAGKTVLVISSSACIGKTEEQNAASLEPLRVPAAARCEKPDSLREQNESWWKAFWKRAPYLSFHSENGRGEQISEDIDYFFYIAAITSRGKYMPRYGGLLFSTGGDFKMWGSQYWWHNSSCYYAALISSGFDELAEAFLSHMEGMRAACEKAAVQQWGSSGLWIPETVWFNGPEEIPEELTEEFRQLYTCRKDWSERSEAFRQFATGRNTFDARYSWIAHRGEYYSERGYGVFGYVTHIFSTTAKIAHWIWKLYLMGKDREWLRERAYPFLRGAAEFYVNLPLIGEGDDGLLHIHHCNNHEAIWDCTDAISELAAMHGILPETIRAARILETDADRIPVWEDFLKRLAPVPTSEEEGAVTTGEETEICWANARSEGQNGGADFCHLTDPILLYDLCTPETEDAGMRKLGRNTLEMVKRHYGWGAHVKLNTLDLAADAVARSADPQAMEAFIGAMHDLEDYENDFCDPAGCAYTKILDNRLTLREGPQAPDAQRLGHITSAMSNAVCQGYPKAPGEEPVLYLFSSLPGDWDARIRMRTAGGWLVEAEALKGCCTYARLSGGKTPLKVKNPWGEARVTLQTKDGQRRTAEGRYLVIEKDCILCCG